MLTILKPRCFKVPNVPVDMGSWGTLACYPRRTFYPLSESLSTKNSRITMADFRLCLICLSYSQASFYHCALGLVSDQVELTFAHLRYSLGGDRPSQTNHNTLSVYTHEKTQIPRVVFQGRITSPTYPTQGMLIFNVLL